MLVQAQAANTLRMLLVELAAEAEERPHGRELVARHPRERFASLACDRPPDPLVVRPQLRGELDDHPPPVRRVADPARVAGALEPVDDGRDRRGCQTGQLRKAAGGQRTLVVDDAETAAIRDVDPELLVRRLVERLRRGLVRARLVDDVGDQVLFGLRDMLTSRLSRYM